jgi:hypothetical protein
VSNPDPRKVAGAYRQSLVKTAGEVIFKKDRSGDVGSWAYTDVPPTRREIPADFNYSPRNRKPLAKILRSTLAALGHVLAAYTQFAKLKSARLSPDGSLGGRGYIQNIADMRKQYMNCVEALSALSDTVYDEIHAPHWAVLSRQEGEGDRAEVSAIIEDAEKIRRDPQEWAEEVDAEESPRDHRGLRPQPKRILVEETEDQRRDFSAPPDLFDARNLIPATMGKVAGFNGSVRRVAREWLATGHEDRIPGGLADEKMPADFDQVQLERGVEVEREHASGNRELAREIAMDHLTEDPDYYQKLKKIEEGAH